MGLNTKDKVAARKEEFLEILEKTGNISYAANQVGVTYHAVYKWRMNKDFDERVEEARKIAVGRVEASLFEQATGIKKLDEEGNFKGWDLKPNTFAAIAVLNNNMPEQYSNRQTLEVKTEKKMIEIVPSTQFIEEAQIVDESKE